MIVFHLKSDNDINIWFVIAAITFGHAIIQTCPTSPHDMLWLYCSALSFSLIVYSKQNKYDLFETYKNRNIKWHPYLNYAIQNIPLFLR